MAAAANDGYATPPAPPATSDGAPPPSPFFHPHTPRTKRRIVEFATPGGTRHVEEKPAPDEGDDEHTSTMLGTAFNFVNQIVGCGIVGVPFAIRESGLAAGVFLILLSAYLTRRSLHLLLDTARTVGAPTYEALCEAGFGRPGFLSVTVAMFVLAFGSMVSYLMVVRDTLPELAGMSVAEFWPKRILMMATSAVTMFPLSAQRDMADLAKTSAVSVAFDVVMVGIVASCSPLWGRGYGEDDFDDDDAAAVPAFDGGDEADADSREVGVVGMAVRWRDDLTLTVKPDTLFVGLGVLSFAFVCQHSGFLIAGSLRDPTPSRLRRVTLGALSLCATLAAVVGVTGYLGFGRDTDGNVLNGFPDRYPPANVARGLLGCTMLFVYPMESFVARHALLVVLFRGRSAREGDDHAVLARPARRMALTFGLYVLALAPAIAFEDLGKVLALTGALGGSAMSYIGPGLCYLGAHGGAFLEMVEERWGRSWIASGGTAKGDGNRDESEDERHRKRRPSDVLAWHLLLMPLWCAVARRGKRCLAAWRARQAMCSPYPRPRLGGEDAARTKTGGGGGKVRTLVPPPASRTPQRHRREDDDDDEESGSRPLQRIGSLPAVIPEAFATSNGRGEELPLLGPTSYGSCAAAPPEIEVVVSDLAATAATATASGSPALGTVKEGAAQRSAPKDMDCGGSEEDRPALSDFLVAIGYFIFGVVAAGAGVLSIFM